MATRSPKADDAATPAKAVQDVVKTTADAVAKTAAPVVDAAKPAPAAAIAAAKAPVAAAKRIARAKPVAASKPVIKKAAKAVVTAARKVATPASKEWTPMATTFEAPKMLTDMNDRAKASFEKTQKFAADFGDFNKGNIEAMVESSKIAAKGLETLGQDAADYTRKSFEGMTATLKSLAAVKSPTDFFKLQSDYARSAFDAAVAQTSKNTEAMIKLASDAAQPISSRFAVAVEKVKVAA